MRIFKTLFILGLCALFSEQSQAGIWIQTSASLTNYRVETGDADATSHTDYLGALTAGNAFLEGFFLGGQYLVLSETGRGRRTWSYGPKAGILLNGLEFSATYLLQSTEVSDSSTLEGSGFAGNLGYTWEVLKPLRFGFHLLYWNAVFNTRDERDLPEQIRKTYISPQIAIAFGF